MTAEGMTQAQFAAAFSGEEELPELEPDVSRANRQIMMIPATFYTRTGRVIECDVPGNWAYIAVGVFVTGTWINSGQAEPEESDCVIPYTNIDFIDLHFPQSEEEGDAAE